MFIHKKAYFVVDFNSNYLKCYSNLTLLSTGAIIKL